MSGSRPVAAARLAIGVAVLVASTTLSAAPPECVPARSCQPPPLRDFPAYAIKFGAELSREWIDEYSPMLFQRFSRPCASFSRCIAVWGNSDKFCRDNLKHDIYAECDMLFDQATAQSDANSCRMFGNVFSLDQANASKAIWADSQACSRAKALAVGLDERRPPPRVVVEPVAPNPGQDTWVVVRSFDAEGDPVMGLVTIAGVERGYTFIPMRYGFAFHREWDEDGRATLVAPTVVVTAPPAMPNGPPRFEPVTVAFETRPLTVRLEVTPPVGKWTKGSNQVKVVAYDSVSGKEVNGKLKTVGSILGASGAPIEIRLGRGAPPCGTPVWFAADRAVYAEADLGIARCDAK